MVLTYSVSLPGIKGFSRVFRIKDSASLYALDRFLRGELDFPRDAVLLFKGLDAAGGVVGRWSTFDLGAGTIDEVSLARAVKAGAVQFVYFYDATNKKSVTLTLDASEADIPGFIGPEMLLRKGPVPAEFENGFVSYEDLPADKAKLPSDDEDDWDEEDDDLDADAEEDADEGEIVDEDEADNL